MRAPEPRLRALPGGPVRTAVLVLHGGEERSRRRAHRLRPAYLRMLPFAHDLRRAGRPAGIGVWLLCNRYRGWNKPDLDPVADARWALRQIRASHPEVPVVLVGHSMGGRVALRVADEPGVVAVCALAPWTTANDPVDHLAGKAVLIAHGALDGVTAPADSRAYAGRARPVTTVHLLDLPGEGHAMLRRARVWTLLVRRFVLGVADLRPGTTGNPHRVSHVWVNERGRSGYRWTMHGDHR